MSDEFFKTLSQIAEKTKLIDEVLISLGQEPAYPEAQVQSVRIIATYIPPWISAPFLQALIFYGGEK